MISRKVNMKQCKPSKCVTRQRRQPIRVIASSLVALALGTTNGFGAPQASLTLRGCDTAFCHHDDTAWTLDKTGEITQLNAATGEGTVTWTITATKGATSDATIEAMGTFTIEN